MAAGPYHLTVDDTAPQISFTPNVDPRNQGDPRKGWQTLYIALDEPNHIGVYGVGESYHVTALDGAQLSVEWNGALRR
jgi:hypothetical protein